jgi:hypothetical protein
MASTVIDAKLKVKITETVNLNGQNQGSSNTIIIPDINEISKRILTITTAESTIATFSTAVASAGHYVAANVRYIRFTNLMDSGDNFITLTFRNQDNDEVAIKLDAGQSFIWNGDNSNGMTAVFNATQDADAASDTAFGSLTNIQADANTGSCDLEMFIASV